MTELTILHNVSPHIGWAPINHLISLACHELGATAVRAPENTSRLSRQMARLRSRPCNSGKPHVLYIAMTAADLRHAVTSPGWRDAHDKAAVWVIDSFHTDLVNARDLKGQFDQVFVTRPNDVSAFATTSGLPTTCLPWGSDVLGMGGYQEPRDLDLLRVGRQPPVWEDDDAATTDCACQNIQFHGRPPMGTSDDEMAHLFSWYRRAKFVLASSNLVSPAAYVHKTQEYVTARWTDALANGAIVAGVPPKTDQTYSDLLWPEATLEIPLSSRADGLKVLTDALHNWTPDLSRHNYEMALARLDWRHRLAQIAEIFSLPAPTLHNSLAKLKGSI
ncbi:hypothetical protein [Shimia sp.]|uniref:hypothetical protein n=1 Tax=Shimia sp. TaxID=1954381 RepID=UPI00329A4A9E